MRSFDNGKTDNEIKRFNRQQRAVKAAEHYFNLIDKILYKNLTHRKNIGVERIVFLQSGESGRNEHLHFVAKTALKNTEYFCRMLKVIWEGCIRESSSKGEFEIADNNYAVANYLTHEYGGLKNDTFEIMTTHLNAEEIQIITDTSKVKMRVLRRLLKTAEANKLQAKNYALKAKN